MAGTLALVMKTKSAALLAMIVLMAGLIAFGIYQYNRPRILILQSYDPEYGWTRDVDIGLHRVIDTHPDWLVRWHYMDLKRHPTQAARDAAGHGARMIIDQWVPEIVIAIDDDAQAYATRHYIDRPDIKIVFAGVNGEASAYGYDKANNVTGILERKQLAAIRDTIQNSNLGANVLSTPRKEGDDLLRLMHLADQSGSVEEDDRFIRNFDWQPLLYTGSRLVKTYAEWQAVVLSAPSRADVILLSNYRLIARSSNDPTLVPPQEIVLWTQANSRLPLIGANNFFVDDGGMLAIGTSGFEQGEVAANMAARLLDGHTKPRDIAQTESTQFVVAMRAKSLAAHKLKLPEKYEAAARANGLYYEN